MRRVTALILAVALLSACGDGADDALEARVFYAATGGGSQLRPALEDVAVALDPEGDLVQQVLDALAGPGGEGLVSPLPDTVEIVGKSEPRTGTVSVRLSESFDELTGLEQTIAVSALVLSLCSLEGVNSVSVYAGPQAYAYELTEEDVLLYDKEADLTSRQTTLYFADADLDLLIGDPYILSVGGQATDIYTLVVEELLNGAGRGELRSVIPSGTALEGVQVEDGVCTLDLSAAFYAHTPATAAEERLILYSLVNSLTGLPGVESVQFLREGDTVSHYLYIPLDAPLPRNEAMVLEGDREAVYLYLWSDRAGDLVELPAAVQATEGQARVIRAAEAAIDYAGEPGYENPVYDLAPQAAVQRDGDGLFTIRLTAIRPEVEDPALTARALLLAVTEPGSVEAASIQVDGEPWPAGSEAVYRDTLTYTT